jgi:hypothetical protein
MGTRNLTVVVLDGKERVAKYCQWDGYPDGQGRELSEFITNKLDLDKFKKMVRQHRFATQEDVHMLWIACGAKPDDDWVSMEVSNKFNEQYPYLGRDIGAKVLELIQDGKAPETKNDLDFAGDSLFCEYAYVVDLDREVVEIYRGYNKNPLDEGERFAHLTEGRDNKEYYPVKFWKSFAFKDFTKDAIDKLSKEDGEE